MSDRSRKIFLASTVIVPFVAYCVYYYAGVFKNAPYKFTEFKSFTIQYGQRDSMLNKYDSKTGDYQFLDSHDSLVKMHLRLSNDELLYLHRNAAELGFWDFPTDEKGDISKENATVPRYVIAFNYQRKSKRVVYDGNFYYVDPRLKDANEQFIKQIQKVLDDAEQRQRK